MESLDRQSPLVARSGLESSHAARLGRSTVKIHSLMAILLLVGAANSGRSDDTLVNPSSFGAAYWTLANGGSGTNAQIVISGGRFRINIEGFNRQRDIEIAKDSRKLLLLAIALQAELDRNPGSEGSSSVVRKVRAIETLARAVKRKMQMTRLPGPL